MNGLETLIQEMLILETNLVSLQSQTLEEIKIQTKNKKYDEANFLKGTLLGYQEAQKLLTYHLQEFIQEYQKEFLKEMPSKESIN